MEEPTMSLENVEIIISEWIEKQLKNWKDNPKT